MKRSIDGRALPCPQPVIKVKKAFDEGGFKELEVLVDNQAAVENIIRFAENSGYSILSVSEDKKIHTIIIESNKDTENVTETDPQPQAVKLPGSSQASNIFINSSTIGSGDPKLGEKLMEAFLFALTELDNKPEYILMMNGGIKVAVEGSSSIDNLKDLEKSGVKIMVCGACLDFFGIKDKLAVGKISNMYEFASILTGTVKTVTVG